MSNKGVDIQISVVDYQVLELLGKREGKTPNEIAVEMVRDFLDDPDKAIKQLLKTSEKAKELGLTLDEYYDRKMKQALKVLKG